MNKKVLLGAICAVAWICAIAQTAISIAKLNGIVFGDAYASLSAAVSALPAGGGQIVYVLPHTFTAGTTVPSSTRISCVAGATFTFTGGPYTAFNFGASANVELDHCGIVSSSGALYQAVKTTNGASQGYIHDNSFTGSYSLDVPDSLVSGAIVHVSGITDWTDEHNYINISGFNAATGPNSVQGITFEQIDTNNPLRVHTRFNTVIMGANTTAAIEFFNASDSDSTHDYVNGGNSCYLTAAVCTNNGYGIMNYSTSGNSPTGFNVDSPIVENTAGTGIYIQGILDARIAHAKMLNVVQQQPNTSLTAAGLGILGNTSGGKIVVDDLIVDTTGTECLDYEPQSTSATASLTNLHCYNLTNTGHFAFWLRGGNIKNTTLGTFFFPDATAQWPVYMDSTGSYVTIRDGHLNCKTSGNSTCINFAGALLNSHIDLNAMQGSNNACIQDSGGSYNTEIGNSCTSPTAAGYVTSFTHSVFLGDIVSAPGLYGFLFGSSSSDNQAANLQAIGSTGSFGVIDEGTRNSVVFSTITGNSSGQYTCGGCTNPISFGLITSASPTAISAAQQIAATAGISISNLLISQTAPTISSGFGTSPSVTTNNGTASFTINVGGGGTATTGIIGLPAATNSWNCFAEDISSVSATIFRTRQIAGNATTVTLGNFNSAATAAAWAANDILSVSCFAR